MRDATTWVNMIVKIYRFLRLTVLFILAIAAAPYMGFILTLQEKEK